MINDRGTKKWTSIMMPEHIKMLEDMWKEADRKMKPTMDEQLQVEFGMKLQLALKDDLTVEVKYYADYDFKKIKDKIIFIDSINRNLQFRNGDNVCIDDIIDVVIL